MASTAHCAPAGAFCAFIRSPGSNDRCATGSEVRDNATTGEETDYIAMGSHTVGRFDEAGAFTWTHSDQLGSASAAANASGAVA